MTENKGNIESLKTIGRFDMAKNFAIGGMSGMIATSCVRDDSFIQSDSTNGHDQSENITQG